MATEHNIHRRDGGKEGGRPRLGGVVKGGKKGGNLTNRNTLCIVGLRGKSVTTATGIIRERES